MKLTTDEIVARARAWIGTPYVHQASLKGAGCDCLGLVRGIFREVHGAEPEAIPPYSPDWSEVAGEERLWAAARRHLREKPVEHVAPGDVALMRMRPGVVAKHVGIVASRHGELTLIHAFARRGVVESPLVGPWAEGIVAAFSFPGSSD